MYRSVAGLSFVTLIALVGCGDAADPPRRTGFFETTLSPQETQRARKIVETSPVVDDLRGSRARAIGKPGLWSTESNGTIGAVVPIDLEEPMDIAAGRLAVFDDCRGERVGRAAYRIGRSSFTATGVTTLMAYVDFELRSVVAFSPEGVRTTFPPDYKPCPGRGDGD